MPCLSRRVSFFSGTPVFSASSLKVVPVLNGTRFWMLYLRMVFRPTDVANCLGQRTAYMVTTTSRMTYRLRDYSLDWTLVELP